MSGVRGLPGAGCRFYRAGRCLWAEFVNPGLDPAFRCRVGVGLEDRFDALIDRCERMGIELEAAGRIWQSWCATTFDGVWPCAEYAPDPDGVSDQCARFWDGLCVLRFPRCAGRCRRYELDRTEFHFEEQGED